MKNRVKIMKCGLGNLDSDVFGDKVSEFVDRVKQDPNRELNSLKVTWLVGQSDRELIAIIEWCERPAYIRDSWGRTVED